MKIQVLLGGPAQHLLGTLQAAQAEISKAVEVFFNRLGIQGSGGVEIAIGQSTEPISVRIGEGPPHSPSVTSAIAWSIVAPRELVALPWMDSPVAPRITENMRDLLASTEHVPLATDFLKTAAIEAIKDGVASVIDDDSRAQPRALPSSLLRSLVAFNVAIRNTDQILENLQLSIDAGRSLDDAFEAAYRFLRTKSIEMHAHPDYLSVLLGGEKLSQPTYATDTLLGEMVRTKHSALATAIRSDFGIDLPPVMWVPSTDIRPGLLGIQINERSFTRLGLEPGEVFVLEKAERLDVRGLQARPWAHPITGQIGAAIASTADRDRLGTKFLLWDELDAAYLCLYDEVRRNANRLVAIDVVEALLSRLRWTHPYLVDTVLSRFSMGDLTRLVRSLLREGVSVADFRGVMERTTEFELLNVEDLQPGDVVVDDRLVTSGPGRPDVELLVEFVRRGLSDQITDRQSDGAGLVVAYRLDGETETSLTSGDGASFLYGTLLPRLRIVGDRVRTTVLTSDEARARVRSAIAAELPEVAVVSESELKSTARVVLLNEGGPMEVQEELLRNRVQSLLADFVGTSLYVDTDGDLAFDFQSGRVFVRVRIAPGDRTVVTAFSITNRDVPPTEELFHWVATHTDSYLFGHIAAEELPSGITILVRHTILGNYLDPQELFDAVLAVTQLAEEVSAEIKTRFGGHVFLTEAAPQESLATPAPGAPDRASPSASPVSSVSSPSD